MEAAHFRRARNGGLAIADIRLPALCVSLHWRPQFVRFRLSIIEGIFAADNGGALGHNPCSIGMARSEAQWIRPLPSRSNGSGNRAAEQVQVGLGYHELCGSWATGYQLGLERVAAP